MTSKSQSLIGVLFATLVVLTFMFGPIGRADVVLIPDMIDFNRFDLEGIGGFPITEAQKLDSKELKTISDAFATQAVNFRYMRVAGLKAAMFQSSFVEFDKKVTKTWVVSHDDSFRVWAKEAAQNGVLVGAYHFYHPEVPIPDQVTEFLANIRQVCGDNPTLFKGKPVLLAFDAKKESGDAESQVLKILAFAREVNKQTKSASSPDGVWPGFYPENSLRQTFVNGAANLKDGDLADFRKCWYWGSRYSHDSKGKIPDGPPQDGVGGRLFFNIWNTYIFWQYSASETWYPKGTRAKVT